MADPPPASTSTSTPAAPPPSGNDPTVLTHQILLASSHHDLPLLKSLLRSARSSLPNPASAQDPETGTTPLHAAIEACEPDAVAADEQATKPSVDADEEERARQTVRLLLEEGAIWNDLDQKGETAGCAAWRLGMKGLYGVVVDAGVRAEMLLNRLGEYQALAGDSDDDAAPQDPDVTSATYLDSTLAITPSRILDADNNGVMMAWEGSIMRRTASLLLPGPGLRVLNVGFGMGIVDAAFQSHGPCAHHIIEAHPAVLAQMQESGWLGKKGVVVHAGRWQDVLPGLVKAGEQFDAIYFDTFAEDYGALREFFSEGVIGLLGEGGRFGFFNGLGADRQVCYDVYTQVVEMDLFAAGFETEWLDVTVPDLDATAEWEGVRRRYWAVEKYRLPVCRFLS